MVWKPSITVIQNRQNHNLIHHYLVQDFIFSVFEILTFHIKVQSCRQLGIVPLLAILFSLINPVDRLDVYFHENTNTFTTQKWTQILHYSWIEK